MSEQTMVDEMKGLRSSQQISRFRAAIFPAAACIAALRGPASNLPPHTVAHTM